MQPTVTLVVGDRSAELPVTAVSQSTLINSYLTGLTTLQELKLADSGSDGGGINVDIAANHRQTTVIPLSASYSLAFDDYLHFCRGQVLTLQDHLAQQLLLANYLEDKAYFTHLRKQVFDNWSTMQTMINSDKVSADVRHDILIHLPYCLLPQSEIDKPAFLNSWLANNDNTTVTVSGQVYCNNRNLTNIQPGMMVESPKEDAFLPLDYQRVYNYCQGQYFPYYSFCIADKGDRDDNYKIVDTAGNEVELPPIFNLVHYTEVNDTHNGPYVTIQQGAWFSFNNQGVVTRMWQAVTVGTATKSTTKSTTTVASQLTDDERCRYWKAPNFDFCQNPRHDGWACLNCIATKKGYKHNIKKNYSEAYTEV